MDVMTAFQMMAQTPNESIREDIQASIDQDFDAVPNKYTIEEETFKGTFVFVQIEAHISHTIDAVTASRRDGEDFKTIAFKDIDHHIERGKYFRFKDNYWLTTFTDEYNQITKDVGVRRCNNTLKWNDNGINHSYPCVIDYDASSSQPVLDEDVSTPNSNIRVIVQGNIRTLNLDINQKFVLSGRPYKIINYVDFLENGYVDKSVPLLYIDMQLIQKTSVDDDLYTPIINEDNRIEITPIITEILQGRTVILNASTLINNVKVDNPIICVASGSPTSNYTLVTNGNEFTLTNNLVSSIPLKLTFTSVGLTKEIEIKLRARF